ncbi:nucleoporin [Purpureocillium lavendulum]|uniref:Nucleoporin n=1 Tax=Purpureocillium lavendulum TaxID=1247861 RepID=A0AB34FZN2_9HYPO|nr:nucleoporin [Purpureocillium lavendulum]
MSVLSKERSVSGNELFGRLPRQVRARIWRYVFKADGCIIMPWNGRVKQRNTFKLLVRPYPIGNSDWSPNRDLTLATQLEQTCKLFRSDQKFLQTLYRCNKFAFLSEEQVIHFLAAIIPARREALAELVLCQSTHLQIGGQLHRQLMAVLGQCINLQVVHCLNFSPSGDYRRHVETNLGDLGLDFIRHVHHLRELYVCGKALLWPADVPEVGLWDYRFSLTIAGHWFEWIKTTADGVRQVSGPSGRGGSVLFFLWTILLSPTCYQYPINRDFLRVAYMRTRLPVFGEGRLAVDVPGCSAEYKYFWSSSKPPPQLYSIRSNLETGTLEVSGDNMFWTPLVMYVTLGGETTVSYRHMQEVIVLYFRQYKTDQEAQGSVTCYPRIVLACIKSLQYECRQHKIYWVSQWTRLADDIDKAFGTRGTRSVEASPRPVHNAVTGILQRRNSF